MVGASSVVVEQHLEEKFESDDLVSVLLHASDTLKLSDKEIADEILTFLMAGCDTISASLSWVRLEMLSFLFF